MSESRDALAAGLSPDGGGEDRQRLDMATTRAREIAATAAAAAAERQRATNETKEKEGEIGRAAPENPKRNPSFTLSKRVYSQ